MKRILALFTLALLCVGMSAQVAQIGEATYATLQEAVDAAGNGDLITVLPESGVDEHTAITVSGKVVRIQYTTVERAKIYPVDMDGINAEGAAVWTKVKSGAGQHDIYVGTIVCGDFEKVLDYMYYLNDVVKTPFHNCSYFLLKDVTLSGNHYDPSMGLEQGHYYLSTNVGGGTSSTIRAEIDNTYLDLNGCTIEQANSRSGRDGYALLAVQFGAHFTLKDSSTSGAGKLVGTLTGVTVEDASTFTMEGGQITCKGQVTPAYAAEYTYPLLVGQKTTGNIANLEGGSIKYRTGSSGTGYPIYIYSGSTVNVGEDWGDTSGLTFSLGTLNIAGGEWDGVYAANGGHVQISGGGFYGYVYAYDGTANAGTAEITGGTYYYINPETQTTYVADGYTAKYLGDNTWQVVKAVARIGSTLYGSLADAVAAAPEDGTETTIVMIADDVIPGNAGVTIPATKNIVLDLNGKTVKNAVNENKGSQVILNKGTLTIEDNSAEKTGLLTNAIEEGSATGDWWSTPQYNYATNVITNNGILTVKGGTIHGTATSSICYAIDNNSSAADAVINLEGGKITSLAPTTMRMFCNSTTNENALNMPETSTVEVEGGYTALYIQLPGSSAQKKKGTLNIAGGTLTGGTYAFYDYSYGDLYDEVKYNLSGGTYNGSYAFFSYGANIDITDGEYNGEVAIKQANPSEVSVSGGKFAGDVYTYGANATEMFISGGVFKTKTYEYNGQTYACDWLYQLVDGYAQITNTDRATREEYPYTVGPVLVKGNNATGIILVKDIATDIDGNVVETVPANTPFVLKFKVRSKAASFNQWGSTILATGDNPLATGYSGGFQFYQRNTATSVTTEQNLRLIPGSGQWDLPAMELGEDYVVYESGFEYKNGRIYLDDATYWTRGINEFSVLSYALPEGIDIIEASIIVGKTAYEYSLEKEELSINEGGIVTADNIATAIEETFAGKPIITVNIEQGTIADDVTIEDIKSELDAADNVGANVIVYAPSGTPVADAVNVVVDGECKHLVVEDAEPTFIPTAFTANTATYSRSTSSTWGTICLPYKVVSGNGIQYYQLASLTEDEMSFTAVDEVEAGVPAIFEQGGSGIVAEGEDVPVSKTGLENSVISGGCKLIGVLTETVTLPVGAPNFYIAQNKFWTPVKNAVTVKPHRAYFANVPTSSKSFAIAIAPDDITSVGSALEGSDVDSVNIISITDLQGNSYTELQRGINIVKYSNGKTKKINIIK